MGVVSSATSPSNPPSLTTDDPLPHHPLLRENHYSSPTSQHHKTHPSIHTPPLHTTFIQLSPTDHSSNHHCFIFLHPSLTHSTPRHPTHTCFCHLCVHVWRPRWVTKSVGEWGGRGQVLGCNYSLVYEADIYMQEFMRFLTLAPPSFLSESVCHTANIYTYSIFSLLLSQVHANYHISETPGDIQL